ncbi:MAG: hypothetical protein GOVbin1630_25 [Prokaryotic dsDNA virus sp.]|nr:MAG: hypothetical protein GOVbin1630_25 [Prokaryotic dsDNA virus sp.]|tara:strand:+ start:1068 stop:1460 length:393 start_codon:yes stop_codon:yes gene_type:complete
MRIPFKITHFLEITMMMSTKEYRERIQSFKDHWKITYPELAEKSGLSVGWICRFLGGHHDNTTQYTVDRLYRAIGKIIEERNTMPYDDKNPFESVSDFGHSHIRSDGHMPTQGSVETRAEDETSGNDSPF